MIAPGTASSSPSAVINGDLILAAARTFNILRSQTPVELVVGAQISGLGSVVKAGLGTLELTGSNLNSGLTTLNANGGTLIADSNSALGGSSGRRDQPQLHAGLRRRRLRSPSRFRSPSMATA